MKKLLASVHLLLVTCILTGAASADILSWEDVAVVVSKDKQHFADLFDSGHSQTLRIAMFGDSQETLGGGGNNFIPAMNHEFYQVYQNVPETSVSLPWSHTKEWLHTSSNVGTITQRTTGSDMLPSQRTATFGATTSYGHLARLNTTGSNNNVAPDNFFSSNNFSATIYARRRTGSGEVAWRATTHSRADHTYFSGRQIASGVTSMGLNSASSGFVSQNIGPFNIGSESSLQIIAQGDGTGDVELAGIRFSNMDNSAGVSIQSFAKGGYQARHVLENHGDAGDAFRAYGDHNLVFLNFGANDGANRTAEEFKQDMEALIEEVRIWSGNPDLSIVILGDADRVLSAAERAEFDKFAAVAAEIAMNFDNVLAINSRKLAAMIGWDVNDARFTDFVHDGVHHTSLGARNLAALQVHAMTNINTIPEPSSLMVIAICSGIAMCRRRK